MNTSFSSLKEFEMHQKELEVQKKVFFILNKLGFDIRNDSDKIANKKTHVLDAFDFFIHCESEFNFIISDEDMEFLWNKTIGDIIRYIAKVIDDKQ